MAVVIKTALVTGGAGFLGSHLCDRLLALGFRVICVDNLITGSRGNVAHIRSGNFDLLTLDISTGLDIGCDVDFVFHLASPASPKDYIRLPCETLKVGSHGTINALEVARAKGARFVLASTSEVYGDPCVNPQPESYWGNVNPIGPRSVYDEAKRFSEAVTTAYRRQHGVRTSIMRIFNTYGPRMRSDDGRLVPTLITQALSGKPLTVTGDGEQTRSLCYADDLIEGIIRLFESDFPGPVNLGNPHELPVNDIAYRIRSLTGARSPITHIERPEDDPHRRCPDISLAEKLLGWKPKVELATGLQRTIRWFKDQYFLASQSGS